MCAGVLNAEPSFPVHLTKRKEETWLPQTGPNNALPVPKFPDRTSSVNTA